MVEFNENNPKHSLLRTIAWLHQKLLTVQFYPEEFQAADRALQIIGEMAQKLDAEIRTESEKEGDQNAEG